jgi:hypothetical protein
MPLQASRVLRQFLYAMYFDGVDDYVSCGNRDVLKMRRSVTVCAWIGISVDSPPSSRLLGQGEGAWPDNYRLELSSPASYPAFYVWKSGVFVPYLIDLEIDVRGRWAFACGGYDADSGYLFVQVDDIEKKKYVGDITPLDTSATVFWIMAPPIRSKGMVYEVRVYSRALSLEERNTIRAGGDVKNGLVLWLKAHPDNVKDIDGDGVLEWIDLSGYGNHGKIYGARLVQLIKSPARTLSSIRALTAAR